MGFRGKWIGYPCAGFFGLGVPVAVIQLIPGSTYLRLERSGFTFCNLFRCTTVPWSVVDQFFVVTIRHGVMKVREMVGFNFVASYDKARLGRKIASIVGSCEGALPGTYGKHPKELAAIMNACLAKARGGSDEPDAGTPPQP
jgi:hypothetical protein